MNREKVNLMRHRGISHRPEESVSIVTIQPDGHDIIPLLDDWLLKNDPQTTWSAVDEIRFDVHWDRSGKDVSTFWVYKDDLPAIKNGEFDALRHQYMARRHYKPHAVLDRQLLQTPTLLFREEEVVHPYGAKSKIWLVGGRKEHFVVYAEAVLAAREELEAWLLKYGTNYWTNGFTSDARAVLPTVLAEVPEGFQAQLGTVVPYLAESMRDGVAAGIRTRSEAPKKQETW